MAKIPTNHYCKCCENYFSVRLDELETGDFFLRCPHCEKDHYRHFINGQAVHCEISEREKEPIYIQGSRRVTSEDLRHLERALSAPAISPRDVDWSQLDLRHEDVK